MICQEQHGLQNVQQHGLHILPWVVLQKVGTLKRINPLFEVDPADSELTEDQCDLPGHPVSAQPRLCCNFPTPHLTSNICNLKRETAAGHMPEPLFRCGCGV